MASFNLYIEFDLPPNELDPVKLAGLLRKRQGEIAATRTNPRKGQEAQRKLSLIPQAEASLKNAEELKRMAAEAKGYLNEQHEKLLKTLDYLISIIAKKGFVTDEDIDKLAKRADFKKLSRKDIEARFLLKKIPKKTAEKAAKATKEKPLAKSILDDIDRSLKIIHKENLYAFLNLVSGSSLKSIQQAILEKDREIKRNANKTAEITAAGNLIGQCQRVFKDEATRRSYDLALKEVGVVEVHTILEFGAVNNTIPSTIYQEAHKKAMEIGLSDERAIELILEFAKKKNLLVQAVNESKGSKEKQCGVCGKFNQPHAKHCHNCGTDLIIVCPSCKKENPSTAKACQNCRFSLADMPNAIQYLKQAKEALRDRKFTLARQHLNKAKSFWPNHSELPTLEAKLSTADREEKQIEKELEALLNKSALFQAKTTLQKLLQSNPAHAQKAYWATSISQGITMADAFVKKAQATASSSQKIAYLVKALQYCADHSIAQQAIKSLPPDPPAAIRTKQGEGNVSLSWDVLPSQVPITYKLICKENSPPANERDGKILAETHQLAYNDMTVQTAKTYYYAVYTIRAGVHSTKGSLSQAITIVENVAKLRTIPGDKKIELHWELSPKAVGVRVWKKENGLPARQGDGQLMSGVGRNSLVDYKVENNRTYGYWISAVFKDIQGREVFAPGISCKVKPSTPAEPKSIELKTSAHTASISWVEKPGERIQLYRVDKPDTFKYRAGQLISWEELSRSAKSLPSRNNRLDIIFDFHGIIKLIPVTVQGDYALIGHGKELSNFLEVEKPSLSFSNGKVSVKWEWPEQVNWALVQYGRDASSMHLSKKISKKAYKQSGSLVISDLDENWANLFVCISSLAEEDEPQRRARGKTLSLKLQKAHVTFSVLPKRKLFGSISDFVLEITSDEDLPTPLILAMQAGNLPLSLEFDSVEEVLRIEPGDFRGGEKGQYAFSIQAKKRESKEVFFRLFPAAPQFADLVQIHKNSAKVKI